MMRTLLIALAVVIAVLAFVLNQVWLYWAAGALLVAAVVVVVTRMWQRYQEAVRFQKKEGSARRHAELSDLGILEVRPRTETPEEEAPDEEPIEEPASPSARDETAPREDTPVPSEADVSEPTPSDKPATPDRREAPPEARDTADEDAGHPVWGPYLQALRAATDSHTVCLLVQEDVMPTYRIAAAASHSPDVPATGTFEIDAPLLSASMSQRAITVQPVGEDGIDPVLLGYYEHVPDLAQVAFAPVPTPSAASSYFLVVDAVDSHLKKPRAKKIITHFAELLGVLIESAETEEQSTEPMTAASEDEESSKPRPRREIIAEEIEEAMRASVPLALALVHLNEAERLAQKGKEVVADAESTLRARLERSAPRSRVERFGELTFGVFYNGDVVDVEPWAERLQEEMAGIEGALAGGVSIGVAMLRDEAQSPEALREDATEALWMAYETGTCTIVE